MELRYLGHAAFEIKEEDKTLLIDPFLKGNPKACAKPEDFEKVDLVFITHAHADHLGDAVEMARITGAKIVAIYDIASWLSERFGIKTVGMNYGRGEIDGFEVVMVPAWHSSSYEGKSIGNACGFIIGIEGKRIYHAGDTCVFSDMKLFAELYPIDIALLPIGGHFTMDILQAVKAAELIKPKIAVPMHYNTWPLVEADAQEFKKRVEELGIKAILLEPGERLRI